MITLKEYQRSALATLSEFLSACAKGAPPEAAFAEVRLRNRQPPVPYLPARVDGGGPGMPYVCLRVPTGGGKTLMACHAAGIAMDRLTQQDRAVVLWLVPNTTILEQTVGALRDSRHAYRAALEEACGPTEVLAIDDALHVTRASLDSQTVVIVSTIQAFRVEDTTGRHVYASNGALMDHFSGIPASSARDLLPGSAGPEQSLVNVLRLRRPIVIVDEAHNARTDLSFSTLGSVRPACIIEFTATPAHEKSPSNVLHHVTAAELKAAEMIKLPLRVVTRHPSQRDNLLADAIAMRNDLEALASAEGQQTGEYIRPILLVQAERVDDCEPLRARIVSEFNIPRSDVKISVGTKDELKEGPPLSSEKSSVRILLTVKKLAEGWDCPYAYILCTLRESRAATSIEQIVGRVLRLPGAKTKGHEALNCAYVYSISDSLVEVLTELKDALLVNGFSADEAKRILIPVVQGALPLGAQPEAITLEPGAIDPSLAKAVESQLAGRVRIEPDEQRITILTPLSPSDLVALTALVRTSAAKELVENAAQAVKDQDLTFGGSGLPREPSPAERRMPFAVPRLAIQEAQGVIEFEAAHLLESPWRLSEKDASVAPYDPRSIPTVRHGKLDINDSGRLETAMEQEPERTFIQSVQQQSLSFGSLPDWTESHLIAWLDRHIEHQDIPYSESAEFIRRAINGVIARTGASVQDLARDRFRLRDAVEARINVHRSEHRVTAYQTILFDLNSIVVSDTYAIDFARMPYEPRTLYAGPHRFKKHYFGDRPGELPDGTQGGQISAECRCALFLEDLPEIEFWVRNLARRAGSLSFQTSTDRFFPDFVCKLKDGRILVVEYKGEHLYDSEDSREKRAVGSVWESRSNGRCLFIMPKGDDFSEIRKKLGLPSVW